jgi:hypothetical protein
VVAVLTLVGLLLVVGSGAGIWALVNAGDDGKRPPAGAGTTTTEAPTGQTEPSAQTPAARLKDYFAPINDSTCSEVAEKDRLVGGATVEIRCKPDKDGVDVSYVYFGTRKVMDDYTKFLQGHPDKIRISIDSTWKYTDKPGDVGHKVSYYHPGSDSSYLYWTYQDDLMGAIASRSGKDEAALEQWWVDVDILRHD